MMALMAYLYSIDGHYLSAGANVVAMVMMVGILMMRKRRRRRILMVTVAVVVVIMTMTMLTGVSYGIDGLRVHQ